MKQKADCHLRMQRNRRSIAGVAYWKHKYGVEQSCLEELNIPGKHENMAMDRAKGPILDTF